VDLEAELVKERDITEGRMTEIKKVLSAEIKEMKVAFHAQIKKSIEESEGRMTSVIKQHIGELLRTSEDAIARIEQKASDVADKILKIMQDNSHTPAHRYDTSSPARKQSRNYTDDVEMNADEDSMMHVNVTPANHLSPHNGRDKMVGERK
jgi:hypothetical protein